MRQRRFDGIGVSPGIAVGPAKVLERRPRNVPRLTLPPASREGEISRLESAVVAVRAELAAIEERAGRELGSGIAQIIDAQLLMLDDDAFLAAIRDRIGTLGRNAEWAAKEVGDDLSARFARLSDAYVRERGNDVDDLTGRVLRKLCGLEPLRLDQLDEAVILVAHDLSPADTAVLDRERVLGFATEIGGRTSHTAIMARSLEIPAVAAVRDLVAGVAAGDVVVLDGSDGLVVVRPDADLVDDYRGRQLRRRAHGREQEHARDLPSVTPDGFEVRLLANIESAHEAEAALRHGAVGVGLFRSEYLYLRGGPEMPNEEEHVREYRAVLQAMAPHAVCIRTLDLGGEKDLPGEFSGIEESNALLGLRAIRRSLRHPRQFETQVRALLRASPSGTLRIVLPFITGIEELREARLLIAQARQGLVDAGVPVAAEVAVGVMLEVPSAALIVDHLADEADFFSVGTNDLIQYLLAVDRGNEAVADLYQPLHPAVLRLLDGVVKAAAARRVPLNVCGEAAADPLTAMVLLGLGVQELSMTPGSIPVIRSLVRRLPIGEARELVGQALGARTAHEVEEVVVARLVAHFPDGLGPRS